MLSASGDGLPDPVIFFDTYWGPCPSILNCYFSMSSHLSLDSDNPWTEEELVATHTDAMPHADRIVWVHRPGDLSATEGSVGSSIGRIRGGYRAIGSFTRCV
ncbi:hypothetical protein BJ912DRAFT_967229, partial [Pholiota molesta]